MKFKTNLFSVILLTAILAAVFSPYLFNNKTFLPVDEYNMLYKPFSENHPKFEPFNHFEDDILKWYFEYKTYSKKHLYRPYWSPNIFGGIPWYANTYASHFSSTNWILKFGSVEKMYPLQLILQLWIAGLGMFLLLRAGLALSADVSVLFSMSFMLSSMFITLLMRWWILGAFSWVPFLLFSLMKFWEKKRVRYFALSSLFLALSFLDGFLQSQAFVLILLFVFSLSWWFCMEKKKNFLKFFLSIGFIVALAVGLSAIMWLPSMEYFFANLATGWSRARGSVFGKNVSQRLLTIPFLFSFFMPQLIGSVRAFDFAKLINSHLQDFSAFVGSAPLLFGLSGILRYPKIENRMKPFFAVALLGLFVPILTPLDRFVYFRFLIVYITGICVLGALSLEDFLKSGPSLFRRAQKFFFTAFGFIFLGVVSLNILLWVKGEWLHGLAQKYIMANINQSTVGSRNHEWMMGRVDKTFEHFSLISPSMIVPFFMVLIVFLALRFYKRKWIGRNLLLVVFIATTFLELFFFARSWLPINDPKQYPFFAKNYVTDFLIQNSGAYRTRVDDWSVPTAVTQRQILPTDSQVVYGFKTLEGFDGMIPKVVFLTHTSFGDYHKLGLLNVKYILTNPIPLLNNPALKLIKTGSVAIYENNLAKARGRIVYRHEILTGDQDVLKRLEDNSYDGNTVFFDKSPPKLLNVNLPFIESEILSESDNQITYRFDSVEPGYFVASETYYPGWRAWLDGEPVDILRANYIMRAVVVPKGVHVLEFKFQPTIYTVGLYISLLSFLIFLVLFLWPKKEDNCLNLH